MRVALVLIVGGGGWYAFQYVDAYLKAKAMLAGHSPDERDQSGKTALMYAAKGTNARVVEMLLDMGADVNAQDEQGETALIVAAGKGHADIVKLLLDRGADVNARDDWGRTALKLAETEEVAKLLRAYGAKD